MRTSQASEIAMVRVTDETRLAIERLADAVRNDIARQVLLESLSVAIDDPDEEDDQAQTFDGIVADAIDLLETFRDEAKDPFARQVNDRAMPSEYTRAILVIKMGKEKEGKGR